MRQCSDSLPAWIEQATCQWRLVGILMLEPGAWDYDMINEKA